MRTRPWLEPAVAGAAILVGTVLRFVTKSHLWLDEALSVDIARLPIGQIPAALRHDGHPPLYYFILHGWMVMFGQSSVAVRALSGVFGVISLPLAWLAGNRLGGRRVAWLALLLLAVSPFALRYSTETRMYALVIALVLAGYLVLVAALERTTPLRLAAIVLITGALLLSHYWCLWLCGAVFAVVVFRWWRWDDGAEAREAGGRRRVATVAVAMAVGALFLVPWLPSMRYQSAHTGTPWAPPARITQVVEQTMEGFGGGDQAEGILLGAVLLGLFALGLLGRATADDTIVLDLRTGPPAQAEAAVVGGTVVLGTLAGYVSSSTYAPRYAAAFFPLFLLVAAVGVSRFTGRVIRAVVVAGLLALAAAGAYRNVTVDRTQAGVIADAINAHAHPGDVVVFCPDQLGPAVHRLLPASLHQWTYPDLASPDRVNWVDYASRNAASSPDTFVRTVLSRAPSTATIWVVENGGYRTLEGKCDAVVNLIGAARPGQSIVVAADARLYFENASLFEAPAPSKP